MFKNIFYTVLCLSAFVSLQSQASYQAFHQAPAHVSGMVGGNVAPRAYFPDAARKLTNYGLDKLYGSGSFAQPQPGSALAHRAVLFADDGVNALKAFYTNAINEFTPNLQKLLEAEEYFRQALRVDPNYEDALNGLLEVYYARAEGFTLIGNEFLANAYRHKFTRSPQETRSIRELELGDIGSALKAYDQGFKEFMKLFNRDYVGLGDLRKPHLAIDPFELFFTPRLVDSEGRKVSFASRRGGSNSLGNATKLLDSAGRSVGVVQGSPSLGSGSSSGSVQNAVVEFLMPKVVTSNVDQKYFDVRISADINSAEGVETSEVLIEFDSEKLIAPELGDIDFTLSEFSVDVNSIQVIAPGQVFKGKKLFSNQVMVVFESTSPELGSDIRFFDARFRIKPEAGDIVDFNTFSLFVAGSGSSLLSGYKDIALLYKIMSEHVDATKEKIERLYSITLQGETEDDRVRRLSSIIDEELDRITTWYHYTQNLLVRSTRDPDELKNLDTLQDSIASVSASINQLSSYKGYLVTGANPFGYTDDYLPFYNGAEGSYAAIKTLVIGGKEETVFSPNSAGGYFSTARDAEVSVISVYDKLLNTKDRIRNELFNLNQTIDNRLVQVVGRVDSNGDPSSNVNDDIDTRLIASHKNPLSEIGQAVLALDKANILLDQTLANIEAKENAIQRESKALQDRLLLEDDRAALMSEYSSMQINLDKEITGLRQEQRRLQAVAQAAHQTVSGGMGSGTHVAITLASGFKDAAIMGEIGKKQVEKARLATQERIKLVGIDTQIFELQATKTIENMVNELAVQRYSAHTAAVDVQVALGGLNQSVAERDELLAKRTRSIANLGEMSYADPTFRLKKFNVMKKAEAQLSYVKRWTFLLAKSLYYKWALPNDYQISIPEGKSVIDLKTIERIQVVGAASNESGVTALQDSTTLADYIEILTRFDELSEHNYNPSPVLIDQISSNNSSRFSIREDLLRIVRTADTTEEIARLKAEFRTWINAPERFNEAGDLVIEFNTINHKENYDLPVTSKNGEWTHFALRSYSKKPLWNHKITDVGVALMSYGRAFVSGGGVTGSLEYGGTGYVRGGSSETNDYEAYSMRQWERRNGKLKPIEYRTVALSIPEFRSFEGNPQQYMVDSLSERPVAASDWRLIIPASQVNNIELDNIEDVFVYINSRAYQGQ